MFSEGVVKQPENRVGTVEVFSLRRLEGMRIHFAGNK